MTSYKYELNFNRYCTYSVTLISNQLPENMHGEDREWFMECIDILKQIPKEEWAKADLADVHSLEITAYGYGYLVCTVVTIRH